MATPSDRWAINMKGKIITLGDSTINEIHRSNNDHGEVRDRINGSMDEHLPTKLANRQLADLSMAEEAWMTTPKPWWNFIMDRPCLQPLGKHTSAHSKKHWFQPLLERLLSSLKEKHLELEIRQRKILQETPIEFVMMGTYSW